MMPVDEYMKRRSQGMEDATTGPTMREVQKDLDREPQLEAVKISPSVRIKQMWIDIKKDRQNELRRS